MPSLQCEKENVVTMTAAQHTRLSNLHGAFIGLAELARGDEELAAVSLLLDRLVPEFGTLMDSMSRSQTPGPSTRTSGDAEKVSAGVEPWGRHTEPLMLLPTQLGELHEIAFTIHELSRIQHIDHPANDTGNPLRSTLKQISDRFLGFLEEIGGAK